MSTKDLQFEQGPIRPPNEAQSLLLRFTRNCPWNQCEFCPSMRILPGLQGPQIFTAQR